METVEPFGYRRTHRNLVVIGDGLPDKGSCEAGLRALLDAIRDSLALAGRNDILRICVGTATPVEREVRRVAQKCKIPTYIITPQFAAGDDAVQAPGVIVDALFDGEGGAASNLHEATGDSLLFLADALIVVWDGSTEGRVMDAMVKAMRRCVPIFWIDSRPAAEDRVLGLDYAKLPAAGLQALQLSGVIPQDIRLQGCFGELVGASNVGKYLEPTWGVASMEALTALLGEDDIDPKSGGTWWGTAHSYFFALLSGEWSRKSYSPIRAWRGVDAYWQTEGEEVDYPWSWFDRFDRAATHAANRHRDQVVLIYLLASLAVGAAIAGSIELFGLHSLAWAGFELALIFIVGLLVLSSRGGASSNHLRWLNFRQAAEALRVSFVLRLVMANLNSLHHGIWHPKRGHEEGTAGQLVLAKPYHWLVMNLLRDMPFRPRPSLQDRADEIVMRLRALLEDQIEFHYKNARRSEHTHHPLHHLVGFIFFGVLVTVCLHFLAAALPLGSKTLLPEMLVEAGEWFHHQAWLLLITGFLPALAAALHGIDSKIELMRVAKSSEAMHEKLGAYLAALSALESPSTPSPARVLAVRALAMNVAEAMYEEHDAWASLMAVQQIEIPA